MRFLITMDRQGYPPIITVWRNKNRQKLFQEIIQDELTVFVDGGYPGIAVTNGVYTENGVVLYDPKAPFVPFWQFKDTIYTISGDMGKGKI